MLGFGRRPMMMLLTIVFLTCLLRSAPQVEAEFFSAIGDMRTLLDHQSDFVDKLDSYVKEEEKRLDLIKKYLGKVEARFGGPQVMPISIDGDGDDDGDDLDNTDDDSTSS